MFKRLLYRNYRSFSGLKFRFGRRVTKAGWLVLAMLVFTAGFGVDTNLALAYQTFSFLCLLAVAALIGTSFNRASFSAERILPRYGSVGEKLRYRVLVRNRTRRPQAGITLIEVPPDSRPSFEEFRDTPEPDEKSRNWFDRLFGYYRWQWLLSQNEKALVTERLLSYLRPQGTAEIELELLPLRRGHFHFRGMNFACPDPFGLFHSLKKISLPETIVILPRRYSIPAFDLAGITKYQQGGVAMASSVGESEEFVSLRDYRPGDPLRHIHWRSFAKAGRPIVKEFQDEFFVRHALILDTFGAPLHSEIFEEAVSVAASFACTIQTQDSLLDLMFVGPQAYCFTAGRGVGQLEQMLEVLASVQPCRQKPFASLKQLVIEHVGAVSGCICIFLGWDEERRSFVEHLKVLGVPMLVFVVTAEDEPLSPGPLADQPENFHVLRPGKIGEALAKL